MKKQLKYNIKALFLRGQWICSKFVHRSRSKLVSFNNEKFKKSLKNSINKLLMELEIQFNNIRQFKIVFNIQ